MPRYGAFIDNEQVAPAGADWFATENPFTGAAWAEVLDAGEMEVDRAVEAADRAFRSGPWRKMLPHQRGALLRDLAQAIPDHAQRLGEAETRDNGKLLTEMVAQCRYLPQWLHYYAGLADKIEGRVLPVDKPGTLAYTRREPLGVVAAIVPWNSPLLLTIWKLAPALAAGNTIVVKPSEYASTSMLELMRLWADLLPPGVVNVVTGAGPRAGKALAEHPKVRKIAFTGGETAGVQVAMAAARRVIPVTLELGGKSANIVMADADLENAVKGACAGIFAASGQTCIAGSRLLLHRSIHDAFLEQFLALARSARLGDPMDPGTQVGPITTRPQYARVLAFIDAAKAEGAELALGGGPSDRPQCGDGWFIEPTVFTGVRNDMRLAREEVFGPVLGVIAFDDEDEAVCIANDVDYGLAAGVWTRDLRCAHRMAERLEAGSVWVNTYRTSAPQAPFGGYKRSGLGREGGQAAIDHFLQTKAVWIDMNDDYPSPFTMRL